MEPGVASELPRDAAMREAFLARFRRVPSGLDPEQVFALFQKAAALIEQLEAQARRSSAPFVIQTTLREAAEICGTATEMAERAYDAIVAEARREAERIRAEARRQAAEVEQDRQGDGGRLHEQAAREAQAIVAAARRDADELRKTADDYLKLAEATLQEARRYAQETAGPGSVPAPATNESWTIGQPVPPMPDHERPPAETPPRPSGSPHGEPADLTSALDRLTPRAPIGNGHGPKPDARRPDPRADRPSQPGRFEVPGWLED